MDNQNENSLSSQESLNYSILIKLKHFFAKIFSKQLALPEGLTKTDTVTVVDEKETTFAKKYGNKSIEQIQVLYEAGDLKEDELPSSKIEELKELYVNQILTLDSDSIKYSSPF